MSAKRNASATAAPSDTSSHHPNNSSSGNRRPGEGGNETNTTPMSSHLAHPASADVGPAPRMSTDGALTTPATAPSSSAAAAAAVLTDSGVRRRTRGSPAPRRAAPDAAGDTSSAAGASGGEPDRHSIANESTSARARHGSRRRGAAEVLNTSSTSGRRVRSTSQPGSSVGGASTGSSGAARQTLSSRQSGGGGGRAHSQGGWSSEAHTATLRPVLAWRDACRVTCMAVSPGGHLFTGGDPSGGIRVWDSRTGAAEYLLEGHQAAVLSLMALPFADVLLSGGADRTARLWSLQTLQNTLVLEGHKGLVSAVTCVWLPESGLSLFTGCDDGTVRHWNGSTGACLCVFREHAGPVNAVAFLRGAVAMVASGGSDGQFMVYNLLTKKCASATHAHPAVWSISQLETDERVITSGSDDVVRMWANQWNRSPVELTRLRVPGMFARGVRSLFSYRQYLFAGGMEGEVVVWDAYNPPMLKDVLVFHTQTVTGLTLESNKLCTCSFDHTICRWDIQDRLLGDEQPIVPLQPLLTDAAGGPSGVAAKAAATSEAGGETASGGGGQRQQQDRSDDHITPEEAALLYAELPLDFTVDFLKRYNFDWPFWVSAILFAVFIIVYLIAFATLYPVEHSFYLSAGMEAITGNYPIPSFRVGRSFASVTTPAMFFDWLNMITETLWLDRSAVESDTASSPSNPEGIRYPTLPGGNVLLSSLQVRVKRTGPRSCSWNPQILRNATQRPVDADDDAATVGNRYAPYCFASWTANKQPESIENYVCPLNLTELCKNRYDRSNGTTSGAQKFADSLAIVNISSKGAFVYNEQVGVAFGGALLSYTAGGYASHFYYGLPYATQRERVNALEALEFIDGVSTRLIDTSAYVYNPITDVFFKMSFLIEAPTSGAWFPSAHARGFEVFNYSTMKNRLGMQVFFFIMSLCALAAWTYNFVMGVVRSRTKVAQLIHDFLQPGSLIDLLSSLLVFVSSCYFFAWLSASNKLDVGAMVRRAGYTRVGIEANLHDIRAATINTRVMLSKVNRLYNTFLILSGITCVVQCVEAVTFLAFSPLVAVFAKSIRHTWICFLSYVFIIMVFWIGFAAVAHLLFGPFNVAFRGIPASLSALHALMLGGSGYGGEKPLYEQLLESRYNTTIIFFLVAQVLFPLLAMCFYTAILVEGYTVVSQSLVTVPITQQVTKWVASARYNMRLAVIRRHWPLLQRLRGRKPPPSQARLITHVLRELSRTLAEVNEEEEWAGGEGGILGRAGAGPGGVGPGGSGSGGEGSTAMLRQTDLLFIAMGALSPEHQADSEVTDAVRELMERLWADLAWWFHHNRWSEQHISEREEDALLYEGIHRAVGRLTEAFALVDSVGGGLEAHEMNLRPLVKSMECMS